MEKQENLDFENIEIGKELPPIEPKEVLIVNYKIDDVNNKEGKDVGKKLSLIVDHPDRPEMEISKVKFEKNGKLSESGLWLNLDKDGKLPHNSAVSHLLRFVGASSIKDLVAKKIFTVADSNNYLICKAY